MTGNAILWLLIPIFMIFTPISIWLIARKQPRQRVRFGCLIGGAAPLLFMVIVAIVTSLLAFHELDLEAKDNTFVRIMGAIFGLFIIFPLGVPGVFMGMCLVTVLLFAIGNRTPLIEWLGALPDTKKKGTLPQETSTPCPHCGKPINPADILCPHCTKDINLPPGG